jgi:hypothetical protein
MKKNIYTSLFTLCLLIGIAINSTAQQTTVSKPFSKANFGAPARIPGAIQAEDFDEGGEGVGYHNVPPIMGGDGTDRFRKLGLEYRDAETEIEIAYGTNMLAAMRKGEWWVYTVEVMYDGIYEMDVVSSGWHLGKNAGSIRMYFDGADMIGSFKIPYTGRWQDFSSTTFYGFKLKKGIHVLKVVCESNDNINLDLFRFRKTVNTPYKDTYHPVPGSIEAENFDEGPENVAFCNIAPASKTKLASSVNKYRQTPVELKKIADKTVIPFIKPGEWWKYSVDVKQEGNYAIDLSYAISNPTANNAAIRIEIVGDYDFSIKDFSVEFVSDLIQMPYTGKRSTFGTVNIPNIKLKKGIKNLRISNETGTDVLNMDSFRFTETAL